VRTVTRLIVPCSGCPARPGDRLPAPAAEAISASLSALESLTVRSTAAAARFAADAWTSAPAAEAGVDVALLGTLLRGDQVRVSIQLVEAPTGTVIISGWPRWR
jgi:TolB-like protein